MALGLAIAPVSLAFMHLPFDAVPWYKQLAWHYIMLFHVGNIPGFPGIDWLELLSQISHSFLPHLEDRYGKREKGKGFLLTPLTELSREEFEREGGGAAFKAKWFERWEPVKLRGFAPNLAEKWSMRRFAETHGDVEVFVFSDHRKSDIKKIKFRDLSARIMKGEKVYGRAIAQILQSDPTLLDDLPLEEFKDMRESPLGHEKDKEYILQFFSAKNTFTQVHGDFSQNFNIQFEGEKRWIIFPPAMAMLLYPYSKGQNQFFQGRFDLSNLDFKKFPCLRYVKGYEMYMRPGDMLWLPSWWWHGVENITTPACSVACDTVGPFRKLFSTNFSMTLAFFAHPYNPLELFIATAEETAQRWTI
eukprot:CAMPEP_0184480564 /NCGR_PEP_ID=MMETSP0113_2-20130426/2053_1 /TAXON_ID=91329 /ORGANISM="Norrisiella sphaerica, Strain BC52" /LENGTH=359 /DNA_ID=CAMNT_0026859109 /DNA_START=586 /DNA_END=1665 /DNA_ORIENTATION=+